MSVLTEEQESQVRQLITTDRDKCLNQVTLSVIMDILTGILDRLQALEDRVNGKVDSL